MQKDFGERGSWEHVMMGPVASLQGVQMERSNIDSASHARLSSYHNDQLEHSRSPRSPATKWIDNACPFVFRTCA